VITRLNVRDLRARVHDLASLQLLLNNPIPSRCTVELRIDNSLHAKLYIFDDIQTIVSSSNLSYAAFYKNHEVAIATTQLGMVRSSVAHFEALFRGAEPVTDQQLDEMSCKLRVLVPVLLELEHGDSDAPDLASEDEDLAPVPLDSVVIEAIDASLEERLTEDLSKDMVTCDPTRTTQDPVDSLCEHRLYEDLLCRFQSVFGRPFPDLEDLATLYAHVSSYDSLRVAKPNRARADSLEAIGKHALKVAILRLVFEYSKGKSGGEAISTKATFICGSNYLVAQLSQLGLSRAIMGRSLGHSGTDNAANKRVASRIATVTAHKIIGYLFETRNWDDFLVIMRRLLRLEDEFPFESYGHEMCKARLQQLCQNAYECSPKYEVISREGPDHDVLFGIRVYGGKKHNKPLAEGLGRTKKQAETDAAFRAIALLKDPGDRLASQGLRTTFPWVFWGCHGKYNRII
jgi:ribonuclease-3